MSKSIVVYSNEYWTIGHRAVKAIKRVGGELSYALENAKRIIEIGDVNKENRRIIDGLKNGMTVLGYDESVSENQIGRELITPNHIERDW